MDDEIIQGFRDMKEASQEKRAHNREQSTEILRKCRVPFESHNGGAHLVIMVGEFTDFWPGTGKWIVRGGPSGRGVFELLKQLGVETVAGD